MVLWTFTRQHRLSGIEQYTETYSMQQANRSNLPMIFSDRPLAGTALAAEWNLCNKEWTREKKDCDRLQTPARAICPIDNRQYCHIEYLPAQHLAGICLLACSLCWLPFIQVLLQSYSVPTAVREKNLCPVFKATKNFKKQFRAWFPWQHQHLCELSSVSK